METAKEKGEIILARRNFFERMEREINFRNEYIKIENMVLVDERRGYPSIEDEIDKFFLNWKRKGNYASFQELRAQMGFQYTWRVNGIEYHRRALNADDFILYCEMMLNMFYCVIAPNGSDLHTRQIRNIIEIMKYDLAKINHEIVERNDRSIIIVQKDAAATAVVDIVEPDLAEEIIEYNHHMLKGNLREKQMILKRIADALEPRRAELKAANKTIENDFFYMVNAMNVRHNNCDPADQGKYNEKFAKLSAKEQEEWYDNIYQEGLMAFLSLEQVKREKKIADFKKK